MTGVQTCALPISGSGLVAQTGEIKKEVLKHRDRLIRVESELAMKIEDRT